MNLFLLAICCVIATSLAGQFSEKEEKLEAAIRLVFSYYACHA